MTFCNKAMKTLDIEFIGVNGQFRIAGIPIKGLIYGPIKSRFRYMASPFLIIDLTAVQNCY